MPPSIPINEPTVNRQKIDFRLYRLLSMKNEESTSSMAKYRNQKRHDRYQQYGSLINTDPPRSDCELVFLEGYSTTTKRNGNDDRPCQCTTEWILIGGALLLLVAFLVSNQMIAPPTGHVAEYRDDIAVMFNNDEIVNSFMTETAPSFTESRYLMKQPYDNFGDYGNYTTMGKTWNNPYFVSDTHFGGPGFPIFVVLGGEGVVDGILYPIVPKLFAKKLNAAVLQTEHRFYGHSNFLEEPTGRDLEALFTPEQAMEDFIRIIRHFQKSQGCSLDKNSPDYCPVATIGGSYPGFLSAIMRLAYPETVDIGYASSAPMRLNAHVLSNNDAYFEHVEAVVETAVPGCNEATRSTLQGLHELILASDARFLQVAQNDLGICLDTMPAYMKESPAVLAQELTQLVVGTAADMNMEYYPPSNKKFMPRTCRAFMKDPTVTTPQERYADYLKILQDGWDYKDGSDRYDCFDLMSQIPSGKNATISSADWTGVGPGTDGEKWEFQVCKDLVIKTGYSNSLMFYPPRAWSDEWAKQHCRARFGEPGTPQPNRLNNLWHFDHIEGATQLLFTNGLNDGWSVGSYLKSPSTNPAGVRIVNFPNGSHHSDLRHSWPLADDTDDVIEGRKIILEILTDWFRKIKDKGG